MTTALAWNLPNQPIYGDFEPLNQNDDNAENRIDTNVIDNVKLKSTTSTPTSDYQSYKNRLALNFLKTFYQHYLNKKSQIYSPYVNSNYTVWKAISDERYTNRLPNTKLSHQYQLPFPVAFDNSQNYNKFSPFESKILYEKKQ